MGSGLLACCGNISDTPSQSALSADGAGIQSGDISESKVLPNIRIPAEIMGEPDCIHIVQETQETLFYPDSKSYEEILNLLSNRLPEKMKQAAMDILWIDDSGEFDWNMMSKEFSFVRLEYYTSQNVIMDCFKDTGLPPREITFSEIIFPLSEQYGKICIIDTQGTYGVLDYSSTDVHKLLAYKNRDIS